MRQTIIDIVDQNKDEIVGLGKYIHANPELAFEEHKSSQECMNLLEKHGFKIEKNPAGLETAFKARYKGGKGDKVKVAFLAEYDALNKLGHACGHNIIAATAVGAGIALSKIADQIDGEIIVMGTPAEEGGGGKVILLDGGEFDDVDYALMIHPSTGNLVGRGGRATMRFKITFHGKSAHSSAQENGIDALNAIIQLFNGINSVRPLLPINSNIHGYITEGGIATNIVTEKASAEFSIRAMTTEDGNKIKEHLERVIKSVETLTMAKAEYELEHGYSERYPNHTIGQEFKRNLESFGEEVKVAPLLGKFGSSDIGNVSLKLPIIHSYVKITDKDINAHAIEFTDASNTDQAYEQTIKAVKSLALTGYKIFSDGEFRKKIDKEFKENVPQAKKEVNMYDILLKNGMIYDGYGNAPFKGDIGIKDGKINKIDKEIQELGETTIDLEGLAVSPGFIDIHSHSDNSFLQDDRCESKIYQGVTTEVVGQCGATMFPCREEDRDNLLEYLGSSDKYDQEYYASSSLEEFVGKLKETNKYTSTNLAPLIGHGPLRAGVMGLKGEAASEEEVKVMAELLDEEMAYGAWGLSLGLGYAPGIFANQDELNALGEIVAKYEGIIMSHMRNQGENIMEALDEMYEISRETGSKVHIAHLKMGGKKQWGTAQALIDNIKKAESEGVKVTKDMYPYTASASGITNILPKWTLAGGKSMAAKRFKTEERKEIMEFLEEKLETKEDGEGIYIVSTFGKYPIADDKNVYELSQELGVTMAEAVEQIIINTDGNASGIFVSMSEEDVMLLLKEEDVSIGSDGYALPLDKDLNTGKPHPRSFGTFPRFLKYVREDNICSLETAVKRITKLPADTMGFKDRGVIEEGKIADLTIFDPKTIEDKATYKNPFLKPIGIKHVIIDGEFAVYDEEQTDLRLGEILLKTN